MSFPTPEPIGNPVEEYLAHAQFHARVGTSGIGAAVVRSAFEHEAHFWDCVAADEREWHYIRVLGIDLGPFPSVSNEDVEDAIDRFAAGLPRDYRLRALLNANPVHLHRNGEITD
jgi:hypothetical protein